MKKILILCLFLFACDDDNLDKSSCVLVKEAQEGNYIYNKYKCYEDVYTEEECRDYDNDGWTFNVFSDTKSCKYRCEDEGRDTDPSLGIIDCPIYYHKDE